MLATLPILSMAAPAHAWSGGDDDGGGGGGSSSCPSGNSAISSYYFVVNGKTVSHLGGAVQSGGTVIAYFTIAKKCSNIQVSLASYKAPAATYDRNTADQQVLFDSATGNFSAGAHSLKITVPPGCFQVDFVRGAVITHLGPASSHNFYGDQSRLIDHDNGCTTPPPPVYGLYLGYADTYRPPAGVSGLPSVWVGSPGVTFVGCSAPAPQPVACPTDTTNTPLYDAGAIRLDNRGTAPMTVIPGNIVITPACTYTPWVATTYTIPVGGTLILTQTGGPSPCGNVGGAAYNLDTSESNMSCTTPATDIPAINLTINGVATTLLDKGQILNTAGIDQGACNGQNEFRDWTLIP